jgi:outer membrane protein OmpA-like peptidoglycan-associated protein
MKRAIPLLLLAATVVWATMVEAGTDKRKHPVIKEIPGFVLEDSKFENFSSYKFKQEMKDGWEEKEVKGKYWFLYYEYKKGDRKFSKLEIIENYKQAAIEKGGRILSEDDTKLDFSVPLSDGRTIWTRLHTWVNSYELYIIEEKGFKKRLTLGAEEMKKELDATGHVAIYGIHFDFDKATLKPGSEKVLIEMVKLMRKYSRLCVEIQGHTDSVGTRSYNLGLSERRAAAVKSFLILYGIAATRMTIKGYGPDKPVASNNTEDGRALNRRVELKKL